MKYGTAGRAFNGASGMHNYTFGDCLLQCEITEKLTRSEKLFGQGAPTCGFRNRPLMICGKRAKLVRRR